MKLSRVLFLVLLAALPVPAFLAADVVPASRQFEVAPPRMGHTPTVRYFFYSAKAVDVGSHGFVAGWDFFYTTTDPDDHDREFDASEGAWLLPDGRRAEGILANGGTAWDGAGGIQLARTGEMELVAVWHQWRDFGVDVAFRLVDLNGRLTTGEEIVLGDLPDFRDDLNPVVASNGQGLFVIAWTRLLYEGQGRSNETFQTMARVFGADGTPLTPEIAVTEPVPHVSSGPPDEIDTVAVGMDAEGNFVVLWLDSFDYDVRHGIRGRRFDRDGQPLGEPFRVGTTRASLVAGVTMAMRPTGDFVAAWQAPLQSGVLLLGRFSPEGQRLGLTRQRTAGVLDPAVDMDSTGRVALFWIDGRRPALAVFSPALGRLSPVLYDPPASRDPRFGRPGVAFADNGRILTVWAGPRGPKARDSILGRIWQVR
jgi:hypothetical protein